MTVDELCRQCTHSTYTYIYVRTYVTRKCTYVYLYVRIYIAQHKKHNLFLCCRCCSWHTYVHTYVYTYILPGLDAYVRTYIHTSIYQYTVCTINTYVHHRYHTFCSVKIHGGKFKDQQSFYSCLTLTRNCKFYPPPPQSATVNTHNITYVIHRENPLKTHLPPFLDQFWSLSW